MVLLAYEQEILQTSNEEPCLVVTATGLPLHRIISQMVSLYANEQSLALLLNLSVADHSRLALRSREFVTNMTTLGVAQRNALYKNGGVFYGSSTIFISDFINKNIPIEKVSSIIVLNAENIKGDGTNAFILYIFRKLNSLHLVKAFSNAPLLLSTLPLETRARALQTPRVIFYPRFHELVCESLADIEAEQIYLRLSRLREEIAFLITDLIRNINHTASDAKWGSDYISILLYSHNSRTVHRMRVLLDVLFTCDAFSVYSFYKELFSREKASAEPSSWAYSEESHLLLEKCLDCFNAELAITALAGSTDIANVSSVMGQPVEAEREYAEQAEQEEQTGTENEPVSANIVSDVVSFMSQQDQLVDYIIEDTEDTEDESKEADSSASSCGASGEDANKQMRYDIASHQEAARRGRLNTLLMYRNFPKLKQLLALLLQCEDSSGSHILVIVRYAMVKCILSRIILLCAEAEHFTPPHIKTYGEFENCTLAYDRLILLNPSLSILRKIEVYTATIAKCHLNILWYKKSIEEQMYLMELREEKLVFNRLISERSIIPKRSEMATLDIGEESPDTFDIVIDSREMRASLPFYLYRANNSLQIKTLPVGDYLCGNSCIERKGIEDFRTSLRSGRLYRQASRMAAGSAQPILLIEFDGHMPTLLGYETTQNFSGSLIAKFCQFLNHFSSFRILWSNNRILSTKLIRDIQKKSASTVHADADMDPVVCEMLLSIPGINSFALRRVTAEFASLTDLAFADLDRLVRVLGEHRARTVHDFFRKPLTEN